jgi:hypothetical protein
MFSGVFKDSKILKNMDPEVRKELEEMMIDSVMGDIIFTDASLTKKFPKDDVGGLKKRKSKVPPPPSTKKIWDNLSELLKKIQEAGKKR